MTMIALGALATFAVFASTTVTNDPSIGTVIEGDVGIYPGSAYTGFPPGLITGNFFAAGAYAGTVKGDAQDAYYQAAGQAATSSMSNVDLMGLTLTPGVYKFDGAAALSGGQLFLDARGNANAVWTFQIGSTLDIATGTGIFFTGGVGNANNVVWQVSSSVSLNANSQFIGTILANEVIALKSKVSVNGRLVSLNGGVTLINNAVTFPGAKSRSTGGDSTETDTRDGLIVGLVMGGVVLIAVCVAAVVYKRPSAGANGPAAAPVEDSKL